MIKKIAQNCDKHKMLMKFQHSRKVFKWGQSKYKTGREGIKLCDPK